MSEKKVRIKGIADFSSLKREVSSLNKVVKDAFGDGVEIFDEDSIGLMKREVSAAFSKMRDEIAKLTKEGKTLEKQFKSATGDAKKQEALSKKQVENAKKRVAAEKEIFRLKQSQNTLETGMSAEQTKALNEQVKKDQRREEAQEKSGDKKRGRILRSVGGSASHATSNLPLIGEATEVGSGAMHAGKAAAEAGMSTGAVLGLGVLAAAALTAGVAVSRMAAGFEVYKKAVPDILKLGGMGVANFGDDHKTMGRASRLGYSVSELLPMQAQMNSAFGKSPHDGNRMINLLTASRASGIDPAAIFGGGEQLRAVGGTASAQKNMTMILEKAFTSGMDKTQASHFLDAAVGLLSELNDNGVTNTNVMLGVMAGLVGKSAMSPEQAAKTLGGMSSAISNSSGEANAFFQMAAAKAGLGGGTLLGSQFTTSQGLNGVDLKALKQQVGDTEMGREGLKAIQEMGLGEKDFTQKYAGAILGAIKKMGDMNSKESRGAVMGFAGSMFGTKSAPEITKIMSLLEKLKGGGSLTGENKKFLEDIGKDPQAVWRSDVLSQLSQIALSTAATKANSENAQFDLGKESAALFNTLTNGLASLDETIASLLAFLKNPLGSDDGPHVPQLSDDPELKKATAIEGTEMDRLAKNYLGVTPTKPKSEGGSPQAPGSGASDRAPSDVSTSDLLQESKKQTQLLDKLTRGGGAPRAGRDTSRP